MGSVAGEALLGTISAAVVDTSEVTSNSASEEAEFSSFVIVRLDSGFAAPHFTISRLVARSELAVGRIAAAKRERNSGASAIDIISFRGVRQ